MKKFLIITLTLIVFNAFAKEPNHYVCIDLDNQEYVVNFTHRSVFESPVLKISKGAHTIVPKNPFTHNTRYDYQNTLFGQLVTAATSHKFVADEAEKTFGLFIPKIILDDHDTSGVKFESILMIGSSGGFQPIPVVVQNIEELVKLECTASRVIF